MRNNLLLLCLLGLTCVSLPAVINRKMEEEDKLQCVSIEVIPVCAKISLYQSAAFPNFKQQYLPSEAITELNDFLPLINSKCSNALIYLLCSVYAPLCYSTMEKNVLRTQALPPCRNLCEFVSEQCGEVVKGQGLTWPPGQHLNCSNYPNYNSHALCFGPKDPSVLPTVDITTGETIVCEASTVGTTNADVTLTSDYNTTSSNVSMTTSIDCNATISNETRAEDNKIMITGLEPNTEYSCTIQQSKSAVPAGAQTKSCRLQFTTQPVLEIQLINDTPKVINGTIRLDFQTNRPVSTMECHRTDTNHKVKCLNGTVQFVGLPPDFYTIRIVAENSHKDQVTLRVRVRVPEAPDHCGLNLINKQWEQDGGNVTVWFETFGPVGSIQCRVDKEITTNNCISPYTVRGEREIKLIPKGSKCGKKSPRTIKI